MGDVDRRDEAPPQPELAADLPALDLLAVSVAERNGATVVTVRGEIDLYTIHILRDALDDALDGAMTRGHALVVVDLSLVRFMGSVAVSELLGALRRAHHGGCELRLAASSSAASIPMRLTGADKRVEHYSTVAAAIRQPLVHL